MNHLTINVRVDDSRIASNSVEFQCSSKMFNRCCWLVVPFLVFGLTFSLIKLFFLSKAEGNDPPNRLPFTYDGVHAELIDDRLILRFLRGKLRSIEMTLCRLISLVFQNIPGRWFKNWNYAISVDRLPSLPRWKSILWLTLIISR